MAIRRKCRGECGNGRRCLEHLWFDVMFRGTRYRMPANDFAIPRMEVGKQRPIESFEEARDWERLFGEIKAGRDPRPKPTIKRTAAADPQLVAGFLDLYFERQVKPAASPAPLAAARPLTRPARSRSARRLSGRRRLAESPRLHRRSTVN